MNAYYSGRSFARRGFSHSVSSTDRKYVCVALTCEKPRRVSVSAASRRHSRIIRARTPRR